MRRSINYSNRWRTTIVIVGWISLAIAVALSPASHLLAGDAFPYTAVVTAAEAAVHSGPHVEFYETERLTQGSEVEVYRHDEEGWHAIRPTENSFSWVLAEHLELTEKATLARVINVPVKTRIGSRFDDAHDVEYVSLRKGEIVQLLGSKMLSEAVGEPARRWFKIAPPSGEFRWIQAKHLARPDTKPVRESNVGGHAIETFDLPDTAENLPKSSSPTASSVTKNSAFTEVSNTVNTVRTVSYESVVDETIKDGTNPSRPERADVPPEDTRVPVNTTHVNTVTWEAVAPPHEVLSAPEPRSFQDRFNALNVMLSRAVLEEIQRWKLDGVRQQTELLLDYASTLDERELATALMAKIDEFENLKQRSSNLAAKPEAIGQKRLADSVASTSHDEVSSRNRVPAKLPSFDTDDNLPTSPEMPQRVSSAEQQRAITGTRLLRHESIDNSIFDASGVLIAVQSRRDDMPKYALTDDDGGITRFVSSSDGVPLARYVNQRVGILGEVGYLRKFNRPHVLASKVVTLQR